jgi:hypothetical protein
MGAELVPTAFLERKVLQIYYRYCIFSAAPLCYFFKGVLFFRHTFDDVLYVLVVCCVFTVLGCVVPRIYTPCVCDVSVGMY